MIEYPTTENEFEEALKDEKSCMEFIISVRWPDGPRCPKCNNDKLWRGANGFILECSACGLKLRPLAGTIFQDTHISIKLWLKIIWHLMSQKFGTNALGLARTFDLSYGATWNILHKLRRCMVRAEREQLGPNVEVDESFIGGLEEGVPGRGAKKKTLVVVAVETDTGKGGKTRMGRIRLEAIPNASSEVLITFVEKNAVPGATVTTDGWSGFNPLKQAGFNHVVKVGAPSQNLLKSAHLVFSLLKRWILGTYQGSISHKLISYYLDEFVFRFNRRRSGSRGKLFRRLVEQAVSTTPVTRKEMREATLNQP
jgi:transposase-like protein/Zn ribbon nucleic-acid-binding protein